MYIQVQRQILCSRTGGAAVGAGKTLRAAATQKNRSERNLSSIMIYLAKRVVVDYQRRHPQQLGLQTVPLPP